MLKSPTETFIKTDTTFFAGCLVLCKPLLSHHNTTFVLNNQLFKTIESFVNINYIVSMS